MPQEFDRLLAEDGLLGIDCETIFSKPAKYFSKMMSMRSMVGTRNQNVVEVDEDEGQANEHSVHQPLEGRPRIPQTKRHADELKQSEGGDDGSLGDVVWKHLDLIVPLHKVEGGEYVGAGHVIRKISNVWNGVLVWNRSIVETPKIPTGAPRTVWFRHHM